MTVPRIATLVIVEPGFGSNTADWQILPDQRETLAEAITQALVAEVSGEP